MADGQIVIAERWYSAADLAGLPGLPGSERGINKAAERDQWMRRQKPKGKGWEYSPASLPELAKRELRRRAAISAANSADHKAGTAAGRQRALVATIDQAVQQRQREEGMARAAGLTGSKKARMDARSELLAKYHEFAQTFAGGKCTAQEAFVAAYRAGDIYLPVHTRQQIGCELSIATLRRYLCALATEGPAALSGNYGNRAGSGLIESQPALRDFVLALIAQTAHIGAANLHTLAEAHFAGTGVTVPDPRTFARYLKYLKTEHAQMFASFSDPDRWNSRYRPAFGSASEDVVRLNQRWELDSTPAEVMLVDGRHTIVQVVDIWSRRRLFYVAKTSSAAAVCEALRRAVLAWGIPESVKIDNGKDYVSERVQRAFRSLGAEVLISPPFKPWKKPHVERGFRTFLHGLFELLPGYLGHSVAEAQALRASKSFAERMSHKGSVIDVSMEANDLQKFCDDWTRGLYEHKALEGENWPRGLSVAERVASFTGEVRRIGNERALDILLAEAPAGDGRKVTKNGLRIGNRVYIAKELGLLIGDRVQVFYDERDIGRVIVYHNEEFACVAECPDIEPVSRAEVAAATNAIVSERRTEQRAALRKLKSKIDRAEVLEKALSFQRDKTTPLALEHAENVVDGQPQFEQAERAAKALQQHRSSAFPTAKRAEHEDTAEERAVRIAYWLDQLLAFDTLDHDARRSLQRYLIASEFGGFWTMFTDFRASGMQINAKYDALLPDGELAHLYPRALAFGDGHIKSA